MKTMNGVSKSLLVLSAFLFLLQFPSSAQSAGDYPNKPIQLIVGTSPGGSEDGRARALAPTLEKVLGQPIVVINKPGAAGAVSLALVAKSKPDGYTLVSVAGSHLLLPYMQNVGYNSFTDFTHVSGVGIQPFGIVVRNDAPWKTLGDFIDYVKNHPGTKYGSWGQLGRGHIFMEMLGTAADIKWDHVPYKGDVPCITSLLGGHIQVAVSAASFVPHARAGKLRILALLTEKRSAIFPQVPTLKEVGFNFDFRTNECIGYSGPKGLPLEILMKLENAFKQAVESDEFKQLMDKFGSEANYKDSKEFTQLINESIPQMWEMIKKLGITKP